MQNPTRYLRRRDLLARYGYLSDRSIDNAISDGRLPPPTLYMSRFPLWREDILDAHDAAIASAHVNRTAASRPSA
jgi:predicted DNA-binding transcriptional regulator AlpA